MRSVVVVAGARPNFIKVGPILAALADRARTWSTTFVHTGQHYDHELSGVFLGQLGIRAPDVSLEIGSAPDGVQTGRTIAAFDAYLASRATPPDAVVVVGDVNSTLACALAAAKRRIGVVHVEAGLRSFDRTMPEELNRIVTDTVASLLLVSEPAGLDNLRREGVDEARVRYVGNVMIDTLVAQLPTARALAVPETFGLERGGYAVLTLHRPANVDDAERLAAWVDVIRALTASIDVVFPVHPRTRRCLDRAGLSALLAALPRLRCVPPQGYHQFLGLLDGARLAITDSGGIQEETSFLGVPCITLRANTERPITLTQGTNRLAGDDPRVALVAILDRLADGAARSHAPIEGWDGHAADRIVDALDAWRG